MTIPHDKFCVLPWLSLEASPIGTVRPCCLADDELVDDSGVKYDLATADLTEVMNSTQMKNLRRAFLAKEQPQTCRKCWMEERAGRTSKRMHTLDRLKHMLPTAEWTEDARPLMFLDLKLGNICNLKCRICGSWSSSQFATEEINDTPPDKRKDTFAYRMLRAGAWPRSSYQFWQQLEQVADQIRYIEFTGGEPFLIQEHFDLLRRLVDRGLAHNIEIHYNTNGTVYPEAALDIWQHFRTVEIAFSIDDVADRFEYQRTNAVWSEVNANVDRFFELKKHSSNIRLQVCCTVNVFNVLYLADVADWIRARSFDFVYWNMMHDAWYFSIACLPNEAKTAVIDQLGQHDFGLDQIEIDRICDFMRRGASTDGFMTCMKINDLDRKRGQDLRSVAPELAALLGYETQY
jgi:MoaA/NifB/PqqE/SkfB family radical SAM enzyme